MKKVSTSSSSSSSSSSVNVSAAKDLQPPGFSRQPLLNIDEKKLIDLAEKGGECLASWEGHSSEVGVLAVLENGWVLSGSADNTIKCWRMDEQGQAQCLATWQGHTGNVCALAVLKNGWVLSGSWDGTIKCWRVDEQGKAKCLATWQGHTEPVSALAVLNNGWVVSGASDKTIKCWRVDEQGRAQCFATWEAHTDRISALVVLTNGWVLSGSWDQTIKCWRVDEQGQAQCLATWRGHTEYISALAVLKNGQVLSASHDNTIRCWQVNEQGQGQCLATWQGPTTTNAVFALAVLKNGWVVSGGCSEIKCWQANEQGQGQCLATWQGSTNAVSALAILKNGWVVSGSYETRTSSSKKKGFLSSRTVTTETIVGAFHCWRGMEPWLKEVKPLLEKLRLPFYEDRVPGISIDKLPFQITVPMVSSSSSKGNSACVVQKVVQLAGELTKMGLAETEDSAFEITTTFKSAQWQDRVSANIELFQWLSEKYTDSFVVALFHSVISGSEAPDIHLVAYMMHTAHSVVLFKFPFTLVSILWQEEDSDKNTLKQLVYLGLKRVAEEQVFDSKTVALFKLLLKSALKKGLLSKMESLELDNIAESAKIFSDERFLILKRDVEALKQQVSQMENRVGAVESRMSVAERNVQMVADSVNALKKAFRRQAQRRLAFSIASTGLSFVCAQGLMEAVAGIADLSDLAEVGSVVMDIPPDQVQSYLNEGMAMLAKSSVKMVTPGVESALKKAGLNPDKFVATWIEADILLQGSAEQRKALMAPSSSSSSSSSAFVAASSIVPKSDLVASPARAGMFSASAKASSAAATNAKPSTSSSSSSATKASPAHTSYDDYDTPPPPLDDDEDDVLQAQVIATYKAKSDKELTVVKGNIISVLECKPSGWWLCEYNGRQGLVPGNRLTLIEEAVPTFAP